MSTRKSLITLAIVIAVFSFFVSQSFAADKVLKFGIMGPFTGPAAKTGAEFKGSVAIALEKINYMVGDYKLEPVWIDSQSDPAKATSAYAEAAERAGIQAGVLNWHSSVAVAVMDVAAQYKVPHMFAMGAASTVNEKWQADPEKYSYWGIKGWPIPGRLMAGYAECINNAVEKGLFKPKKKLIAVCCEDTDWGHSAGDSMAEEFEKRGWTVVARDYFPITQTDFYSLLGKYKKKGVSLIASTSSAPAVTSAFIKQSDEIGLNAMLVIDGLGWSGEWYKMTGAASDGVLDMIPQLTTKEAQEWAKAFEAKLGMKPSPSAGGLSYDGINYFIKLLNHTLNKYGKLDKQTIHKVMVEDVNTGKFSFTKADGAIIMNAYKTDMKTMPDPIVARDAYFFPVIQYKGGKSDIVFPADWAVREIETR